MTSAIRHPCSGVSTAVVAPPATHDVKRGHLRSAGSSRENYHEAATLTALIHRRFCGPRGNVLASGSRTWESPWSFSPAARLRPWRCSATGCDAAGTRHGPWLSSVAADCPTKRSRSIGRIAASSAQRGQCRRRRRGRGRGEALHDGRGGFRAYQTSDGLCDPHAWIALREAPKEVSDWLAEDMQGRLRAAEAEIDSWYASLRGGASGDPRTQAWARAAHLLWGGVAGARRGHG